MMPGNVIIPLRKDYIVIRSYSQCYFVLSEAGQIDPGDLPLAVNDIEICFRDTVHNYPLRLFSYSFTLFQCEKSRSHQPYLWLKTKDCRQMLFTIIHRLPLFVIDGRVRLDQLSAQLFVFFLAICAGLSIAVL